MKLLGKNKSCFLWICFIFLTYTVQTIAQEQQQYLLSLDLIQRIEVRKSPPALREKKNETNQRNLEGIQMNKKSTQGIDKIKSYLKASRDLSLNQFTTQSQIKLINETKSDKVSRTKSQLNKIMQANPQNTEQLTNAYLNTEMVILSSQKQVIASIFGSFVFLICCCYCWNRLCKKSKVRNNTKKVQFQIFLCKSRKFKSLNKLFDYGKSDDSCQLFSQQIMQISAPNLIEVKLVALNQAQNQVIYQELGLGATNFINPSV
ncbi:UNKNOWN [Stylonychia lemnae]|uniref:Transmembrane protein n=1 Tax=Stylonychia lemnae TaxID=5949 RepID=A0A078ATD0_STYLE|nr:UNKNOWN [Stylonychia lemnae]|eukprot:CDW85464.1 UNKNOWN [Stylonychia lemnae]